MGSSTETLRVRRSPGLDRRLLGRACVLFFAIGQLVSNVLFGLLSPTDLQSGVEFSPLIPPGAMFSIWGVIIAASIFWSILQIRPSVRESALRDRLVAPLSVVYAGFGVWLAAASLGQDSPLTLVVFVVIVGAHFVTWRRISRARDEIAGWRRLDRTVLFLSEGLYAGWTSMALFVNVATVLQGAGASTDGTWGIAWQLSVVAAAAGTAILFVIVSRGSLWYAAAASYALVGAAISSASGGFTALAIALVIGVVLIIGSSIVVRRVERRSASPIPRRDLSAAA